MGMSDEDKSIRTSANFGFAYPRVSVSHSGFTLLEMIISMTILSLVVLTVYLAFSLGVDVWQRMDGQKSIEEKKSVTLRLLKEDFAHIRPYTWSGEKGEILFFAGGPRCLYYVTTNGLGAKDRAGKDLFFTCLYIHSDPEGEGDALFVYKSGLPGPDILEAVRDFRTGGDMRRANYVPPRFIIRDSVPVINNVPDAQFGYQKQAYPVFSGVKTEVKEGEWGQKQNESGILAETEWVGDELPGQIAFTSQDPEGGFIVRTTLSPSPVLDHKKR